MSADSQFELNEESSCHERGLAKFRLVVHHRNRTIQRYINQDHQINLAQSRNPSPAQRVLHRRGHRHGDVAIALHSLPSHGGGDDVARYHHDHDDDQNHVRMLFGGPVSLLCGPVSRVLLLSESSHLPDVQVCLLFDLLVLPCLLLLLLCQIS
jgi:hypothetical protein